MTTTHAGTRWAPAGLLAATAALYLWGLGSSGWANSFYSAAVQAASQSWKAFFFGSSDAANAITVDKTPASLWPMELSARLFGLNSWSILVPQALMGVATVAVVYATVRRRFPVWAGLLAGAVMALTPVAVLMFRFNNPDALLVLLLTLAAYCVVRAQERAVTRWLVLAGVCLGFAFLAKMLQAFLVLPGFALVYVMTAPTGVWRRMRQLALAGVAMVVSAGWWLLAVALVPASERPYIGGSQTNSVLELALGYNGIGRLNGADYGGLGNLNQEAGPLRLFDTEAGGQISWLLPAALILLAAALWLTRGASRTDPARAQFGVWGGWLAVTGLVFSLMQGIFHAYYTVALALWSYVLLTRDEDWNPWLGPVVLVAGLGLAAALLAGSRFTARPEAPAPAPEVLEPVRRRMPRWWGAVVAGAIAVSLAGPAAYAVDTAASPHTGAIPTAGPSTGGFGPGAFRGGGAPGMGRMGAQPGPGRPGGAPQGMGRDGMGGGMRGRAGGMGGLLDAAAPSAELTTLLKSGAASYTWAAATVGSNNAAGYQLATGLPVMAVGGFNGTDPAPTLARFKQFVAEKKIHYFVGSGMGMSGRAAPSGGGGSDDAARIATWVQETFTATTVSGVTVFDLTTG
ncbi:MULTISPECIES: glycosyltransferase family 39 protein [unclassified Nonomuraea]|uniref:ArnT family glycosyltransferase n=1 Tax=unclassified Nonomuraea TaxID=2593643 RepID=UPI0033E8D33A